MNLTSIRITALFFAIWAAIFPFQMAHASYLNESENPALFKLQTLKQEISADYEEGAIRQASLVNLNTNINTWYLLSLKGRAHNPVFFNLLATENGLILDLDKEAPRLSITGLDGKTLSCDIQDEIADSFNNRKQSKLAYLSVCQNKLLIVIKQNGFQPTVEKGAQVLRWLGGDTGEKIINGVKTTVFEDKYIETEQTIDDQSNTDTDIQGAPPRAELAPEYAHATLSALKTGLKTTVGKRRLLAGKWYPLKNFPSAYGSLIQPGIVSREIRSSFRDRVRPLDGVENDGVVYLMALGLDHYSLAWGHGTDHPGVGWSERAIHIKKDNPYGPDGFDTISPLLTMGHVPPHEWSRTIGTISGGFQNRHSAFRYGKLSTFNKAHHYGFMENGVLMSSPTVGLATVLMYRNGDVEMKTWEEKDKEKLPLLRHMRQNGLPLIQRDEHGEGVPGKWVKEWGKGNWSGSAKKELRTPRGGLCLLETPEENYLVYGYFSGATPSGMARVFQAYGCSFAMQLDLNSPGQAYASLFLPTGEGINMHIELLQNQMYQYMGGTKTPRYLLKPDYKDFFYILKK